MSSGKIIFFKSLIGVVVGFFSWAGYSKHCQPNKVVKKSTY